MKLLAIETATEGCSAALSVDGQVLGRFEVAPRQHGDLILSMVDKLLAEAQLSVTQLDAIAYGTGPGSFIGVRIAAAVTQGVAFAADLPVLPVSTLAVLAQTALDQGFAPVAAQHLILSAIDARMNEVYWGQYRIAEQGLVELIGEESLRAPSQICIEGLPQELTPDSADYYGVGSAWGSYRTELEQCLGTQLSKLRCDERVLPKAHSLCSLAMDKWRRQEGIVAAESALPTYMRNKVAEKPAKKD